MPSKTMFDKIWDAHVVHQEPGMSTILYVDLHIAVTTPFTGDSVHMGGVLDEKWIVDDASRLLSVVQRMLMERKAEE